MASVWLKRSIPLVGSLFLGLYVLRKYFRGGVCSSKRRLYDRTVVVTGCNSGIGKETVKDLAQRGARVIMACRNLELASKAAEDIKSIIGPANLVLYHLDLSDLASVRQCAEIILAKEDKIDILINNAGVATTSRKETKDGFEMHIGTNHFGHFLFTNLLLDKIKSSTPSRIINVASVGHQFGQLDLDDINYMRRKYTLMAAYGQSKLANILFTKELARRLNGTGVTCYSLHPGSLMTDLQKDYWTRLGPLTHLVRLISYFFLKTPLDGAQTTIYCAIDESLEDESGKYYSDCRETMPSKEAMDEVLAKNLWDYSVDAVNLKESHTN